MTTEETRKCLLTNVEPAVYWMATSTRLKRSKSIASDSNYRKERKLYCLQKNNSYRLHTPRYNMKQLRLPYAKSFPLHWTNRTNFEWLLRTIFGLDFFGWRCKKSESKSFRSLFFPSRTDCRSSKLINIFRCRLTIHGIRNRSETSEFHMYEQ